MIIIDRSARAIPEGAYRCWYISEERKETGFMKYPISYTTDEYFRIIKRPHFDEIEGYLGRADRQNVYFKDINDSLTYFIDYKERKGLYFTFDKIVLYRVVSIIPGDALLFTLKKDIETDSIKKSISYNMQTITNTGNNNILIVGNNNSVKAFRNIRPNNVDDLQREMQSNGITDDDIAEITRIVTNESPLLSGELGVLSRNWINKMAKKASMDIKEVGIATAGGILTEILKAYYGINSR